MSELYYKATTGLLLLLYASIRFRFQKCQSELPKVTIKNAQRESVLYYAPTAAAVPILLYIFTPWLDRFDMPIPAWLRWIDAFILLMGDYLFYLVHRALGKNWSPVLEVRAGHVLITDGPYKYMRHPMYSAFYIIGIGLSLLTSNWIAAFVYLASLTIMYLLRVSSEEQMMIDHFGDEYRQYMRRTKCLIPRFW